MANTEALLYLKFQLRVVSAVIAILFSIAASAQSNSGITYHGRILRPDGTPLSGASVQFKMQIRSPGNENCLLYEEVQTKNLRDSNGAFSITINDGTGPRGADHYAPGLRYTLDQVFQNRVPFLTAASCDSGTSYAPNSADGRRFAVLFKDETMTDWEEAPPSQINFVPFALDSKTVAGFGPRNLLRVEDAAASANATPFTLAQFNSLLALINGTSNLYTKQSATGAVTLPSYTTAAPPSAAGAGSIWYDSTDGKLKYHNGTSAVTLDTGSSSTLPTVGTPGTYTKVTTDAQGRVTSGQTQIVEGDISGSISTAGKVSGTAITSGNISTSGSFTTSSTITATGAVSGSYFSGRAVHVSEFSGTNTQYVQIRTPDAADGFTAGYVLTLPLNDGDPNQVLSTNGSGILSWVNQTAASGGITSLGGLTGAAQTFASGSTGNAPAISSSGTVHTLNVPLASAGASVTSGTISNTDYLKFDAKLGTATSFSGDVSGAYNATSVDKIKGTAVTITTPSAGQYLKYTAGGWVNAAIATSEVTGLTTALGDKVGYAAFPSTCTAGQTIIFTSPANTFTCLDISLPSSQITGQVAVANGGTGAATAAQNSVFAGPATGGTGAPSFRALVAGDLPSGTLVGSSVTTGYVPYVSATNTLSNSSLYYSGSNVGIGVTSPARLLHINGPMRMVASALPGTPATGDMAIDSNDSNKLKWYDGSGWQSAAGSAAGITSLGGLTGATQTFAAGSSGNAPAISSSGTVHTLNVPLASTGASVTSGTISNADYLKFDAKLGATTAFTGDVVGTYDATSLDKIKGAALTITTPAAGQYLKYTAGGWVNSAIATSDISGLSTSLDGKVNVSGVPTNCTSAQTLQFASPANTFSCVNISLPTSQLSGQVAIANGGTGSATAAQNSVFAGPATGGTGAPSFRALTAADLPSGTLTGVSGTAGRLPYFATSTSFGDSPLHFNGTNIGIGTTTQTAFVTLKPAANKVALKIDGSITTDNGAYFGGSYDSAIMTNAMSFDGGTYTAHALGTSMMNLTGGEVRFYTNYAATGVRSPSQRFTIDKDGNVGIGVTSPSRLLHVNGPMRMVASALPGTPAAGDMAIDSSDGNKLKWHNGTAWQTAGGSTGGSGDLVNGGNTGAVTVGTNNATALTLETNNSPRMTFLSDGKVGIGTTNPSSMFQISGSSSGYLRSMTLTNSSAANWGVGSEIAFEGPSSSYMAGITGEWFGGNTESQISLKAVRNGSTVVGLKVGGEGYSSTRVALGDEPLGSMPSRHVGIFTAGEFADGIVTSLLLSAHNPAEVSGVGQGGQSGIGTEIGFLLESATHAQNANAATIRVVLDDATATSADASMRFLLLGANANITTTGNEATEKMRINSAGNVGINTTNPTQRLHVVGNAFVDSTYDCTIGTSTNVSCSSDGRLKENVLPIEAALDKVLQLRGVEFDWNEKSNASGRHDIGVIAQEVEKVFPSAVSESPDTGYKMVDYPSLVSPLIQALKEFHAKWLSDSNEIHRELASIKSENAQLKASDAAKDVKIKSLENRLERIEKLLEQK